MPKRKENCVAMLNCQMHFKFPVFCLLLQKKRLRIEIVATNCLSLYDCLPSFQEKRTSAKKRAKDIFEKIDKDGDGELTMKEFVDGYLVMMVEA